MRRVTTGVPTLLASGIAGFSADFWFAAPALRPTLIAVALAVVLVEAYESLRVRRDWLFVGVGGLLALVHLALAPILVVLVQKIVTDSSRRAQATASSQVVADAGSKETILVFAPDHIVSVYLPVIIGHLDGPAPKSWRPLSIAPYDHSLKRTGSRTLELEVEDGGVMLRSIFEELYRDPENRLEPGDVIDRGLLRAEILAANDRGPTRIAFHFDRDLSDPSLYFLVLESGEFRPAVLPDIGREVLLERSVGPGGF